MEGDTQLGAIRDYVQSAFETDATGHDDEHMKRVANLSRTIAIHEHADLFITEAGALLHDIGDEKLFVYPEQSFQSMKKFLYDIGVTHYTITLLTEMINAVSFHNGLIPESLEGKIVQDADRIDAMGATGIARTFAYGGANGQPIYHRQQTQTSIQHFYDKLLKLKDTMNTEKGKEIAEQRHAFLLTFLEQFWEEWRGE